MNRSPHRSVRPALAVCLALLLPATAGCLGIERSEWAFENTQISSIEDGLSGKGAVVGIVDTGIDADHPALDHVPLKAWRDFVANRADPYDDVGHGTHVAGIIAADTGGGGWFYGASVKGVAPDVSLVVVKACSGDECGENAVIQGIDWAASQGVHIIVLSLGGQRALPVDLGQGADDAVRRATNLGIVVIAAAGNSGTEGSDVETPADEPSAIAVGAVDSSNTIASFSSRGSNSANKGGPLGLGARADPHKKPELVAPGVDVLSTWKDGSYATASGTSQAAPFVAGIVALLMEAHPQLKGGSSSTVTQIKTVLTETAKKVSGQQTPHDNAYGYGLVQAQAALDRLGATAVAMPVRA